MYIPHLSKYIILSVLCLLVACNSANKQGDSLSQSDGFISDTIVEAKGFSIKHNKDKTTRINIINPWDTSKNLREYTLKGNSNECNNENGIISAPLKRVIVYSSVHANIIKELGHLSTIIGVCDPQYFTIQEITDGVKNGTITNIGSSASPSIEHIIALSPDAIILSPYQNSNYDEIEKLGIPIIECADYMETSPLGRAEWIKLFGELFGERTKSDSIYNNVVTEYNRLKQLTDNISDHPTILSENIINGTWFVPGGDSYMAQLFVDAGGSYAWSDTHTSGSIPLDMAQVLDKAHDADVWLIKSFDASLSYSKLKSQNTLNAEFKAFKDKNIYYCNTERTTLFNDFPFHPEMLLKEFIAIFHPDLLPDYETRYYKPLSND